MFIDFCAGPLHAPRSAEPTHDDLKMPALYGEKKKAKKAASASTSHVRLVDAVAGATSQPCADPNELRPAELKRITRGCCCRRPDQRRALAEHAYTDSDARRCFGRGCHRQRGCSVQLFRQRAPGTCSLTLYKLVFAAFAHRSSDLKN